MRNDPGTVSSDYSTSPAPSSNASYSTDFSQNQDSSQPQLPSVAAYHRALAELAAASRASDVASRGYQQANGIDHRQARADAAGCGRGSTFHRAGAETNASSGRGQQPTSDNDQLLTAPMVSLSPTDPVSLSINSSCCIMRSQCQQVSSLDC